MHKKWLFVITAKTKLVDINLKEVWQYRDLLMLFVKRDVITLYKQTILGPLWYLIQPLLTSVIFTLIFNSVVGIQTGLTPAFLFNLSGIIAWNYFKECLIATSDSFKRNEQIFGKVYFPRMILPLSVVISNVLKFGIQLSILVVFYLYYAFYVGEQIIPSRYLFLLPILVAWMGMLGLGLGMIISSMVTKYRDLTFLVSFGVQLLMYISLVVVPLSLFQDKDIAWLIVYNPMAHMVEMVRFLLLNEGEVSRFGIAYTATSSIVILLLGVVIFNRTEKTFMDTI